MNDNSFFRNIPDGKKLGNYIIIKKIGEGGIGAVYLARHRILLHSVAIKIHDYFQADQHIGKAFLQASNYLSQLNHPNIIRFYDYGFQDGHAYQVMEYVEGQTLASLIPNMQTKTWLNQCLQYIGEILSALRYAHNCPYLDVDGKVKKGIIHGDIKPHNIFLDRASNSVKIADFMMPDVQAFLGQHNVSFEDITTTEFGTPEYMAPEQEQGKVSQQTDIFSLGTTLYELVTGQRPNIYGYIKEEYEKKVIIGENNTAESLAEVLLRHTPSHLNPYIPEWLEHFIIKSIEREPSKRFQTIAEMERFFLQNVSPEQKLITFDIKELTMGDKFDIRTGDISNVTGQLFIGKFNEIIANLNSTGKADMAEALKTLKEAVMASQLISEDKKREHIEVINQFGEEAAKEKPNKTLLEIIGSGLVSALKVVPDIAKAIAAVLPFIPHTQ